MIQPNTDTAPRQLAILLVGALVVCKPDCAAIAQDHEESNLLLNQSGPILPQKLLQSRFAGQGRWRPQLHRFAVPVVDQQFAHESYLNTGILQLPHLPGLKRFQSDESFFQHWPILDRNRHDSNVNERKSSQAQNPPFSLLSPVQSREHTAPRSARHRPWPVKPPPGARSCASSDASRGCSASIPAFPLRHRAP